MDSPGVVRELTGTSALTASVCVASALHGTLQGDRRCAKGREGRVGDGASGGRGTPQLVILNKD